MTVTAPKGFEAAGVAAGLKAGGRTDLALVVNRGPRSAAAAVFTSNRCKANPVLWSEQAVSDGAARAVVLNSAGANCYTGAQGFQTAHAEAEHVAELLGCSAQDVIVCSTGIIGRQLPRDLVLAGIEKAVAALDPDGGAAAAHAIMTTDTVAKTVAYHAPGDAGWSIGAIAKGAGMLAPGLATMLIVITTDADVAAPTLQQALRSVAARTFNRLDADGCMSTNDTVSLLASGASGITPTQAAFEAGLEEVCASLVTQLQGDAEGAQHTIDVQVIGAASEAQAEDVARTIARNNLFKTAIAGEDPNWGRVLAAVGTTAAQFDPYDIDVTINGTRVCHGGAPDADPATVDFSGRAVQVVVDLRVGDAQATIWTTDLTHEYVEINSEYES